jgi:hypothetical protein
MLLLLSSCRLANLCQALAAAAGPSLQEVSVVPGRRKGSHWQVCGAAVNAILQPCALQKKRTAAAQGNPRGAAADSDKLASQQHACAASCSHSSSISILNMKSVHLR